MVTMHDVLAAQRLYGKHKDEAYLRPEIPAFKVRLSPPALWTQLLLACLQQLVCEPASFCPCTGAVLWLLVASPASNFVQAATVQGAAGWICRLPCMIYPCLGVRIGAHFPSFGKWMYRSETKCCKSYLVIGNGIYPVDHYTLHLLRSRTITSKLATADMHWWSIKSP